MSHKRFPSIQHGIVFLMAPWSGGAQWAHRHLTEFLQQRGVPSEKLATLDLDCEPWVYDWPEFAGKIHGWGEAAVVKDGRIVHFTILGKDQRRIQEHCTELLRAYED